MNTIETIIKADTTAHTDPDTMNQVDGLTADEAARRAAFTKLLRAYEAAHLTGTDTAAPLYELGQATANSVLKKCIDPQRKTAVKRETVSDSGINPALSAVKRGIAADMAALDNLRIAGETAYRIKYNADGEAVSEVMDKAAAAALDALATETLSDGLDVVHDSIVAILAETAAHGNEPGFMETEYTDRRINRRVIIKDGKTAAWEDVQTSPVKEVYRATRRGISNSRAMQTDPRNGYSYIEDVTADPDSTKEETIYHRLQKYADLGGATIDGIYTADSVSMMDYYEALSRLNLTDRQARIISMRMQGYGYKAVATFLGVSYQAVQNTMKKVVKKCETIGFVPEGENKKRIDRENAIREIIAWIAEADSLTADEAAKADSLYAIAYDEADKHGITSAMLRREREIIAREVSAMLRRGNADPDPVKADRLTDEAYAIAEKYGITSAMLNNI